MGMLCLVSWVALLRRFTRKRRSPARFDLSSYIVGTCRGRLDTRLSAKQSPKPESKWRDVLWQIAFHLPGQQEQEGRYFNCNFCFSIAVWSDSTDRTLLSSFLLA